MHRLRASDFTRLDDTLPYACADDSNRKPCVRRGLHNSRHNVKSLCSPQYVAVRNHTVKSKLSNENMCLHSLKHLVLIVCVCVCDIFFVTAALYWSEVPVVIFVISVLSQCSLGMVRERCVSSNYTDVL